MPVAHLRVNKCWHPVAICVTYNRLAQVGRNYSLVVIRNHDTFNAGIADNVI